MNNKEFGERLKGAMKEKRIKSINLAEEMDVTIGCVSQWRRGIKRPNKDNLGYLAEVLGVSEGWLEHGI